MLPQYQKILVTTDFTENSDFAFKHAVMLARQTDARIYLLHVLAELEITNWDKAHEALKQELKEFADKELKNHPEDIAHFVEPIVATGNPVHRIVETADNLDVDVVIMGTHGKGLIDHALLGSITEKVLKKIRRPIFVVPLPH
jgi:nucleotide-binding universal stress UspA family protein